MILTKPFSQLSKIDAGIAGGKGASLGEMTQAGIPVPPGFVILSSAFERFIEETDLVQEIDSILEKVDHKAIHTVERASEKIRELILNAEMPKDIGDEIDKEFKKLNTQYVAVRSSATAEDGMDHAWAGQLESYLNTTEDQILTKVKLCWSSLFTPRAIFYRFEKGLHSTKISVAVVVQKMVESEVSGIAFSVHPVTEDYNQLIIEAGFGLGEAIVSGSVTPDSYVIEKEPRNILDINISTQNRALYRSERASIEHGNNEWREIPEPQASSQVLNKEQILELSEIILNIENHYGFPCDIEWAFEKGKFYIVQSRPITTLINTIFPIKGKITIFQKFTSLFKSSGINKQEGNFSPLIFGPCLAACFPPYSNKYYDSDIGAVTFLSKDTHGLVLFSFDKYIQLTQDTLNKYLSSKNELLHWIDFGKAQKVIDGLYKDLTEVKLKASSDKKLNELIKKSFEQYLTILSATVFTESLDEKKIKESFQEIGGKDSQFEHFFCMASKPAFESFILRMNKLLVSESDSYAMQYLFANYYGVPPLKDIESKSSSYVKDHGGIVQLKKEISETELELASNKKNIDTYRNSLKGPELKLFNFTQFSMELRDIRKESLQKVTVIISNIVTEIFTRKNMKLEYVPHAFYSDFEDNFYNQVIYPEEIKRRSEQGTSIYFDKNNSIFEYGNIEAKKKEFFDFLDEKVSRTGEIRGIIGYPGKVLARAQIIISEKDFLEFKKGSILVTSMTRPEFVPLMKMAAAVVTDEGGITCHAAIISRELKLPCVIGTKNATRIIKDRDMIEVDADKGIVKIV